MRREAKVFGNVCALAVAMSVSYNLAPLNLPLKSLHFLVILITYTHLPTDLSTSMAFTGRSRSDIQTNQRERELWVMVPDQKASNVELLLKDERAYIDVTDD